LAASKRQLGTGELVLSIEKIDKKEKQKENTE